VKLRLWRKKSIALHKACASDGTCGFQFVYQMYLRGARLSLGLPADAFDALLDTDHTKGFVEYLTLIVDRFSYSKVESRPTAVSQISKYLDWMKNP